MNEIIIKYIADEMNQINNIEELMLIMKAAYLKICKIIQQTISDEKKTVCKLSIWFEWYS